MSCAAPRLGLVVLAALVALAGCGVPTDDDASVRDEGDVPFDLLAPEAPGGEGGAPSPDGEQIQVFMVAPDGDRLTEVLRTVAPEAGASGALDALLDGPTELEGDLGITTALPGPDVVQRVRVSGGTATVDLTESFESINASSQIVAIAQIVYTLTSRPGIGRVSFTLDGGPVEVPREDGALTSGSVSRDAYAGLAPA